jgi:hypothetical protein
MPNELTIPAPNSPPPTDLALSKALEGLSIPEAIALDSIMRGTSLTAAADAANISRKTLYEWLEPGHPFCHALTLWKQDLVTTARTRLLMMSDLCTTNILSALKRGDHRTAMTMLQKLGVLSAPPIGPTHIEAATAQTQSRTEITERQNESHRTATSFLDEWDDHTEFQLDAPSETTHQITRSSRHGSRGRNRRGNQAPPESQSAPNPEPKA